MLFFLWLNIVYEFIFPGYDVQSASTQKEVLYITGAPRYNHTGRVVIYRLNEDKKVEIVQTLNGEQVRVYLFISVNTVEMAVKIFAEIF